MESWDLGILKSWNSYILGSQNSGILESLDLGILKLISIISVSLSAAFQITNYYTFAPNVINIAIVTLITPDWGLMLG